MKELSADWLDKGTHLFAEFGPFFVSLLILLFVLPHASKALSEAIAHGNSPQEVRFRRRVYVGIWGFAGFLILVSVAWWLWAKQPRAYIVRFDISDAQPTDVFAPDSDDLYYRNRDVNDADRRRDTFVAVAAEPFAVDQEFLIVHKKGADATKGFKYAVKLDEETLRARRASFRLVFKDGAYELQPVQRKPRVVHGVIGVAHAGSIGPIPSQQWQVPRSPPLLEQKALLAPPGPETAAQVLLDEKAGLPRQIEALEELASTLKAGRPVDLLQVRRGGEESVLSYVLTLARHEDRLVAYKARDFLRRADYMAVVTAIAASESRAPAAVQRRIVAALSPSEWEEAQKRARETRPTLRVANTPPAGAGQSPVPSATQEGTQYWGISSWRSLSAGQKDCLANVVYRQNDLPIGAAEARRVVEARSEFPFVFGTKAEALAYADASGRCGASIEFVYRADKRIGLPK